jgi:hypothetical protein
VNAALATQAALSVTGVPGLAQVYGATFPVGSSGGSVTGAVTFQATGACSVTGTTVTMTSGTGVCSVTATKASDGNYASLTSPAAPVNAALAAQATLSVTGVPGSAQPKGASFTVGFSGGSGTGAVTFGASGACSISGASVTMTSASGTCSVTATKAADSNFAAAISAAATLSAAPFGPPTQLVFTTQPPGVTTAGVPFSSAVQVQDMYGNPVTSSTAMVSMASTGSGLSGTITVAATNGVAAFSNLVLNSPGTYTLTASAQNLQSATSSSFSVTGATLTYTAGAFVLNRTTGHLQQSVTVTNTSGSPAAGSVAYALDNLAAGVVLVNANGATDSSAPPAGSPYVEFGVIGANKSVTITLQFTRTGTQAITYTARILGPGAR